MDVEIKSWLHDILKAINEIESYFSGKPKDFNAYKADLKTKRAVERNLEIIGEAMNRILNRNKEIIFSNSRKIVDTRNRIIHGYDAVSDDMIWSIVIKHLPVLKMEVQGMLDN